MINATGENIQFKSVLSTTLILLTIPFLSIVFSSNEELPVLEDIEIQMGTSQNLNFVEIAGGLHHTCAIFDDGSVGCWGDNGRGQIDDGTTYINTPIQTEIIPVNISLGQSHSCAIFDDGSVSCWGDNRYSQLGDGSTYDRNTPTQPLGIDAVAISSGGYHTCTIIDNGSVSCWGQKLNGQLGNGIDSSTNQPSPQQTSSLGTNRTAIAISAGRYHTCAILDDGSVSCWGDNKFGQLGDGTTTDRDTPTQTYLDGLGANRTAVTISSGSFHTCAILDDGSVACWGRNNYGQLGDGTTNTQLMPTQTSSLGTDRTAVAMSSGESHTCAILDDGSVACWGYNLNGQLGDGSTTQRNTPTQTSSLGVNRTAVAISAGGHHTCVILDGGSASCWGYNGYRQLADGTTDSRNTPIFDPDKSNEKLENENKYWKFVKNGLLKLYYLICYSLIGIISVLTLTIFILFSNDEKPPRSPSSISTKPLRDAGFGSGGWWWGPGGRDDASDVDG